MSTQHLKLHPLTGNTDHDLTGLSSGQILYVQDTSSGVQSTGLYASGGGTLTATSISSTAISGGTIYSGSTDLSNLFMTVGSVTQTKVQPGSNITTGGTASNPTINLVDSPSINGLTASGAVTMQSTVVISGATSITAGSNLNVVSGQIQSGGTNLESIFTQGTGTVNYVPLWSGTKNLGNSIMSQNGTGVTVNGSVEIYGDVTILGTATTFNTQTVQSQDNNILLNFSGSHVSALGGGITVLSGTPSGVASTWSIDANGAWSANTGIFTTAVTVNGGNIAVTGGGAIISGGTDLYNIFVSQGTVVQTVGQGTNIATGGTATNPTINLVASPSVNNFNFSGTATGGSLTATNISGGTLYSGSTNLYNIFSTIGSNVTTASNGLTQTVNNITLGGSLTGDTNINAENNVLTISADTNGKIILSHSLDEDILIGDASNNDLQSSDNGDGSGVIINSRNSKILCGTTKAVIIAGSGITANQSEALYTANARLAETTGSVIYSAGTDLYDIFLTSGDVSGTSVSQGSNITVQQLGNDYNVALVASPSINGLTASGAVTMQSTVVISGATSITAGSNLNVVSGQIQSGGTNLESIFTQGSGTNGTLPLWNGTKVLGDSILTQSGTGVTVNGSVEIYGDVTILGTATTFNTQTVQSQDNNILLNFSGSHVSALGGGITVLSGTPSGVASTWSIDANGAWSANTGIFTTAVTVNGGNIAVTGGGAIISGGTDLYNIFTTAGTDLTTASNGLTKSGYNVTLGGALTGNTSVNVGANTLEFSGDGSSQTSMYTDNGTTIRKAQVDGTYALLSAKLISNGQGSQVHARLNGSQLTHYDGASENAITVGTTMTIDDLIGSKGIDYALNYHANYTSRTLVDKEYVDNRILSGSVQSVGAGSNITTGGTATNPTISLIASPSVNNFTASGNTSLQGTTGTTIYASQFFSMTPYTGANPAAPANDTFWFHSGATGTITLNYRVGGATKTVELS